MQSQSEFWVFIDKPTMKAKIHRAKCGACKNGRGMHGHQQKQCWWEGFNTYADAWKYAAQEAVTMEANPSDCGLCKPRVE